MQEYEKLGAFYLGRRYDPAAGAVTPDTILYDSKDLTTHALCVGMTGSGKTGLCVSLLEEAAIDGIPVLAIDPKGDLGNLMLTFPDLAPSDFAPWIDEGEALRKGMAPPEYAKKIADLWRNGLAEWGQDGSRIARFRAAAETAIYTPGSKAGIPLRVIRSLSAPAESLRGDTEALGERVLATASGLLGLLGIDADPIRSRETILLTRLLQGAWREGRSLEIAQMIREIQDPPFEKIGVMDLETFFPAKDRFGLAMSLNNLLASPTFATWMEGEPLDIRRLLWTAEGKPKISILSIAHLSEPQRMFFVTLLLSELLAWVRAQPGTTSLRAILYMDEVFGYFPPTANPPSKTPMLTLLKQARAYGLGVVLATQNPVDLDYKGLSNTGTWFLGRLQTERDKARVLDGLEGASASAGAAFDRASTERILSGLSSRVFLMNNVHEDGPVLFHARWALSYLRGPLTREQIGKLMAARTAPAAPPPERSGAPPASERPLFPPGVDERFLPVAGAVRAGDELIYRPAILAPAALHYVSTRDEIDEWRKSARLALLAGDARDPWEEAVPLGAGNPATDDEGDGRGRFAEPPAAALNGKSYGAWARTLRDRLYRSEPLEIWKCPELKATSEPGEREGDFRVRLGQAAREARDLKVERLRTKYAPKLARIEDRIRAAEQRVEREQSQYKQQKMQSAISLGATLLGAVLGRKVASARNVGRATTAVRGMGRAARERGDVARARESAEALREQLEALGAEFEEAVAEAGDSLDVRDLELVKMEIRPRKSDISVGDVLFVWTPWRVGPEGIAEPLYDTE